MGQGDIYFVSLDPTSGHEQRGARPVMVVSGDAFNAAVGTPVVVPITSGGGFAKSRGFAVVLDGAGLETSGIVRCDQPRTLGLKARNARLVETAPPEIVADVLARLVAIFE